MMWTYSVEVLEMPVLLYAVAHLHTMVDPYWYELESSYRPQWKAHSTRAWWNNTVRQSNGHATSHWLPLSRTRLASFRASPCPDQSSVMRVASGQDQTLVAKYAVSMSSMQSIAAQLTLCWLSRLLDESRLANPRLILVSQRGCSEDRALINGRLRGWPQIRPQSS